MRTPKMGARRTLVATFGKALHLRTKGLVSPNRWPKISQQWAFCDIAGATEKA